MASPRENFPHTRILLGTYNGAEFLPAQLESYLSQSHGDWSLDVGDDGSDDATLALLRDFAAAQEGQNRVRVGSGPRRGVAANFLTLVRAAVAEAPGAAVAFSDQDDIWLPQKLARAVEWLAAHGAAVGQVLAYGCRTWLVNAQLKPQGLSPLHARGPSFGNALVQNILGGNTIVLSPAAASLLAESAPAALAAGVPYHDWWIYQLVAGAGGQIFTDPKPGLFYRQHGRNLLGHHGPVRGRLARLGLVTQKHYAGWIDANLTALLACDALLTAENRERVQRLAELRGQSGRRRSNGLLAGFGQLGIHRQTAQGDRILRVMVRAGWL